MRKGVLLCYFHQVRRLVSRFVWAGFVTFLMSCGTREHSPVSTHDDKVSALVRENFSPLTDEAQPKSKRYPSVLVGIVTPESSQVLAFGRVNPKGSSPDSSTVYEVGSVTKGILGILLAQFVLERRIDLGKSFSSTSSLKLPSYHGKKITWRHLAQHRSGLPRFPSNHIPPNPQQPYLEYDLPKLRSFLLQYSLTQAPGKSSDYSNLGAGIVGYGLEEIAKKPLEDIFKNKIFDPLGMNDTRIALNDEQSRRLASLSMNGEAVVPWRWEARTVLKGAGALHSTMGDLMKLMKTILAFESPEFHKAIHMATLPTYTRSPNSQIGLFWNHLEKENITWHNGGTFGSTSFFGFIPQSRVGIIVLANALVMNGSEMDPRLDAAAVKTLLELKKVDECRVACHPGKDKAI